MRISAEQVMQPVTLHYSQRFEKEVWLVRSPEPVVLVRKRLPARETQAAVLLVHGFGQNRNSWHLPQRSFVNHLADAGFDVFNVDLRGHGRSAQLGGRRARGVDDYIREDIPAALEKVVELSGHRRVFLVGHSLGGICSSAVAARYPEWVAGVVSLAPPHALGRGHLLLGNLLRLLGRSVGRTGVLRGSRARLPVNHIGAMLHLSRPVWDSRLSPLPVKGWRPGAFTRAELRSYLETSFDGASLGTAHELLHLAQTGEIVSQVDGVDYTKLGESATRPLLVVCGQHDLLANPGSVKPAFERSRARDKRYVKIPGGHGDLLVGQQAPVSTWPIVTSWLRDRVHLAAGEAEVRTEASAAEAVHAELTQSGEFELEAAG